MYHHSKVSSQNVSREGCVLHSITSCCALTEHRAAVEIPGCPRVSVTAALQV